MALLGKGRFKAKATSVGIKRKGPNNLLCVPIYFSAYEWKDGGEYQPMEGDYGLICDCYIEKKDGTLNENQIKTLQKVFDWDGNLTTLAECVRGADAKITVEEEVYNGKTTPKVQWINRIDEGDHGDGPDMGWSDDLAKQAQNALGAKIRAVLGTKSAATTTAPPRPAQAASAPPVPRPSPPPTGPTVVEASLEGVWGYFERVCADHQIGSPPRPMTDDEAAHEWRQFLLREAGTEDFNMVKDWNALAVAVLTADQALIPF